MRKSMMFGIALGLSLLTAASAFAQLAEKKVITLAAAPKITAGSSMQAMIFTAPPQCNRLKKQVAERIWTPGGFRRCRWWKSQSNL
jgi:hypothetical protein